MQKNEDVVAIYSRKSRFTGKGESIDNQVEMCREQIRAAFGGNYADTAVVFEDEGFSGGNLNRPDFKRMMTAARKHQFRAVVVYRLDRISRNIGDFSALIEELGRLGIDFVSIRENFDTSSPMGRAMMYIASVFSQLERETIAERIRDNMHELAKTGRWLGGITPTGYTSESVQTVTIDGKNKKACHLKLVENEAVIVKTIYELYLQTDSLTMTEAELLSRKIRTKNGKNFTRFSIKSILQNPVYLIADERAYDYFAENHADLCSRREEFDGVRGMLAYNRTEQQKGKSTVYLPMCEWVVTVGQHPGIIESRTWIQIQRSLERNKSKSYRKPRSNEALLTGLLYCACGSKMYPKLSQRTAPDGRTAYIYLCKLKEHSKRSQCSRQNANGNLLDAAVLQKLEQIPADISYFCSQLEKRKSFFTEELQQNDDEGEELQNRLLDIQRKISALVDAIAEFGESTSVIHLKDRMEELHRQEQDLKGRISLLDEEAGQINLQPEEFENLKKHFLDFGACVKNMTLEQKRTLVRTAVEKVIWEDHCAQLFLMGAEKM